MCPLLHPVPTIHGVLFTFSSDGQASIEHPVAPALATPPHPDSDGILLAKSGLESADHLHYHPMLDVAVIK